jgi:hypothetical protein
MTVQFWAVGPLAAGDDELSDATVQFRVSPVLAAGDDELSDAMVQFRAVAGCRGRAVGCDGAVPSARGDPIMPFRGSQPTTARHVTVTRALNPESDPLHPGRTEAS